MKTNAQIRNPGREGSVLLPVLLILFIVAALSAVSLRNSVYAVRMAHRQELIEQAQFAAEAGLEEAARRIATTDYFTPGDHVFTYDLPQGGSATLTITPLSVMSTAFEATSVGTYRGHTRSVKVDRIFVPTYSEYGTYIEDYGTAYFRWGQIMDGKTYIGSVLRLAGSRTLGGPLFTDKVEVGANSIYNYNYNKSTDSFGKRDVDYTTFQKGYELDVPMPALGTVNFALTKTAAQQLDAIGNQGMVFSGKTTVKFYMKDVNGQRRGYVAFKNESRYGNNNWNEMPQEGLDLVYVADKPAETVFSHWRWRNKNNGNIRTTPPTSNFNNWIKEAVNTTIPAQPGELIVYRNSNDTESGTERWEGYVTDDITFYTDDDVTIEGHLRYWDDVIADPTSNDKVMFVSKDDIWIDQTWRTDKADMYVQAAIIATGAKSGGTGKIGVIDYDDDDKGWLGTFHFLGSYVAKGYGYSGTFNSNGGVSGFSPNRTMDYRFVTDPPPFAPIIATQIRYVGWHNL